MTQEITKTLKEISLNFSYVSEQSLFVTVTLVLFYLLSQCHIFSLQHRFCYANKKELVCWQILLINFKKSC